MKQFTTLVLSALLFFALSPNQSLAQGEDCATATLINSIPFSTTFNTGIYKDEYNSYCNAPYDNDGGLDAVFLYNATTTQFADVLTCSPTGLTDFDTKIYIYLNTCPPVSLPGAGPHPSNPAVGCSDDECSTPLNPWLSRISNFQFISGNSYFIVVDGWSTADFGNVTLDISASTLFSDLAITTGVFSNSYGCLPYSQVICPDTGFAILENNGTTDFPGVIVKMDVFCDADTFASYSSSSTPGDVLIGQNGQNAVVVNAGGFTMQKDSPKIYTFCFSHNQTADDTSTNDTIYDFIFVNDSIWCNDLWIVGADAAFFNIVGDTVGTEMAALFIPEVKDTLTSVTVTLAVDVAEIGQAVTVCVYNTIDSGAAPLAISNVELMDTGVFFYTFCFPDGVCLQADSLYWISVKNGSLFVGATEVLTTPFSSWGRRSPTDNWGFFSGLDWMIWANLGELKDPSCPPPTPSTTNIELDRATLNWNTIPGALGYEISGGIQGSNPANYTVIEITNGAASQFVATGLTEGTSYEWRIRAACDFVDGAPVWGPYSDLTFFTTLACSGVTPISTSPITPTSAQLNWTPIPAALGYRILGQQTNPPAGGVVELDVPGAGSSSYNATGLSPNTTYNWGVFAICDLSPFNTGPFSGITQFTTPTVKTGEIGQAMTSTMSIYPNPAKDVFNITFAGEIDMDNIQIEISDVSGKIFKIENTINSNTIQFSSAHLSSGVYQIVVRSNDVVLTDKIVIAD